jgi:hypothetical protein
VDGLRGTTRERTSSSRPVPRRHPCTYFLNNYYGGTFSDDGVLFGNFFPDFPLTESGGFGGIRRYHRDGRASEPVWGLSRKTDDFVRTEEPPSLTIIKSATGYAADPVPLPDGRLLFSWARDPATGAEDIGQDYGLFILDPARPTAPTLIHDARGTTELRAQLLRPRNLPPVVPDTVFSRASATPLASDAELYRDGAFEFDPLNVYFNGPVDMPIVNAPPVGSAATIRFFTDYQRSPLNADSSLNYPVLLQELRVQPDGSVRHSNAPANVPLFEDLRDSAGHLPLTSHDVNTAGGAFVTGMNFGRPGTVARCVGCHAGHTQIPIPADAASARWSNLAPGATLVASSTAGVSPVRLVNRRARLEEPYDHWRSQPGQAPTGQWVDLEFPVPIFIRSIRLYGARNGVVVRATSIQLFADLDRSQVVATARTPMVSTLGTSVGYTLTVAVPAERPPTPTGLSVTLDRANRPVLSWNAASSPSGIRRYRIQRDGSSVWTGNALSYMERRAQPASTVSYTVEAQNGALQWSLPSEPVSISIPAAAKQLASQTRKH